MKFGFSSMGDPDADWCGINALARRFGMDFIELRSLGGTIDLPGYFRAKGGGHERAGASCSVQLLGSSLRLAEASDEAFYKFMDFAQLAHDLRAPYVRVFGGGPWPGEMSADALASAAATVNHCRQRLEKSGLKVRMLLETHDGFSSSERCLALNRILDEPLGILWDSHHTWRLAGESLSDTWSSLGPLVGHIHYKDSMTNLDSRMGYDYVLPGQGEFPTEDLFALLRREKFSAGVSLEWEKLWHSELAPLEEALESFKAVIAI